MFFVRFSILVIILSVSLNVFSQSIEDIKKQKEKAEKEIVYLNKLLKDADKNKAVSTEKVNILQEKIVQSERVLHSLSQELAYLKKDISDNESRIAELERRKESLLGMYANLVYETWKKRNKIDKLMFIFSSSDFNQAYNRFRYFQQIQDYSKRQLKLIEQVNDSLNIRNNELNHLVAQKNDLMVTINTKNRELESERAKENRQIPNPFTPDIRVLFSKEYTVAMRGRDIIREMMGYEISDDEVGFLTLHIHAGLSDEQVSVTLDTTRIINEGIRMIEKGFSQKLQEDSLAYTRLMSHLYYMVARTRNGESTKVDFNDFIFTNYPETGRVAEMVCSYMGNELKKPVAKEEIGFLAIHIQRVISPETL